MTAGAELLFSRAPATDGALLFGETDAAADVQVELDLALPGLVVEVAIARVIDASADITLPGLVIEALLAPVSQIWADLTLPGLVVDVALNRNLDVSRPTVGQVRTSAQPAQPLAAAVRERTQVPTQTPAGFQDRAAPAVAVESGITVRQAGTLVPDRQGVRAPSQDAVAVAAGIRLAHQEMLRDRRPSMLVRSQDAVPLRTAVRTRSQDMLHDRRPAVRTGHQDAVPLRASHRARHQAALPAALARRARSQDAIKPPIGVTTRPVPPTPEPCYLPSGALLFSGAAAVDGALVFICERHSGPGPVESIVIPVRRVYMVTNNVTLRRLGSSIDLPAPSFSIELNEQSWTWGFSASLSGQALDAVSPALDGSPAILVASINGTNFRVFVEGRNRTRTFGKDLIAISGRGINAALDSPYDPAATFRNLTDRTAQQLMQDVLSDNGVPLGWALDWQLDDWLVPAGAWSAQGSRMAALLGIAAAAGGYIQPHPTDQTLRVLHRYPVAPWEWDALAPDFVLPADAVTQEGVEWVRKPAYNRVFVSGQSLGLRAEVTREGTAGDLAAPSVVDALNTDVPVARQRGRAILSDVGNQARVKLRLPVLNETGIILPGKTVSYADVDGTIRFGIVRSTSVDAEFPEVWQSIGVETHV